FEALSGERLGVAYLPSVDGETTDDIESRFRLGVAERRAEELVRRVTLVGPHRDDLSLVVQGMAARSFASHGEAWGAAVCLRLALSRAVEAEAGEPPITFLDDPFSALDPDRRRRLAGAVGGRGQVLVAVPEDRDLLA